MSITQEQLDALFPSRRSDEFFEAIYGDAGEGAYTIFLKCLREAPGRIDLAFELRRRPGKCLMCQLTHGLPHVFRRHPVIDAAGVARKVAELAGWKAENVAWEIGETDQISKDLHLVPMTLRADVEG